MATLRKLTHTELSSYKAKTGSNFKEGIASNFAAFWFSLSQFKFQISKCIWLLVGTVATGDNPGLSRLLWGRMVEWHMPVQSSHPPKKQPLASPPKCVQEMLASGTQLWFKTCKCTQTSSFWYKFSCETKTQGKKLTLIRKNTWRKRTQYFPYSGLWNKQQHCSTRLQRNKARQQLWFLSLSQILLRHFSSHMAFFPARASYCWKGASNFSCLSKQSKLPELSLVASLW